MHHFESINAEKHKKRQQPPNRSDKQNCQAATSATKTVLSVQTLLRSIAYYKMKTFPLPRRLSVSTVFLVSIIVAIVIANETHQKDCVNCVDAADEYTVKKRGGFRVCYAGKCPRRRSRKRGMKMVRVNSSRLTRKRCSFCNFWSTESVIVEVLSVMQGTQCKVPIK